MNTLVTDQLLTGLDRSRAADTQARIIAALGAFEALSSAPDEITDSLLLNTEATTWAFSQSRIGKRWIKDLMAKLGVQGVHAQTDIECFAGNVFAAAFLAPR